MVIKVGINGYGTIGKRVADAVTLQDDMEIVGVTKTRPTYEARMAIESGFPFYVADRKFISAFEEEKIEVQGVLDDLLQKSDIVIDCTPKNAGYLQKYKNAGVKAIFQGGEKHELTGVSFNSMANYKEAFGKDYVRVVSCNTTGLCRTLYPLNNEIGIENVLAVMIRRGTDPGDSRKGPINAIEPELEVPSHHGPDVRTCMPYLNIQTTAVKVPTTIMHLHSIIVKLEEHATEEDVLRIWEKTPRVRFVSTKQGIKSTAQIMELAKDLGQKRSDLNEIAVWSDGVHVINKILYYYQAIHQESDVVPENIDCIRAMLEMETDKVKSMEKTDKSLGI